MSTKKWIAIYDDCEAMTSQKSSEVRLLNDFLWEHSKDLLCAASDLLTMVERDLHSSLYNPSPYTVADIIGCCEALRVKITNTQTSTEG